jgi:hypothetical protein
MSSVVYRPSSLSSSVRLEFALSHANHHKYRKAEEQKRIQKENERIKAKIKAIKGISKGGKQKLGKNQLIHQNEPENEYYSDNPLHTLSYPFPFPLTSSSSSSPFSSSSLPFDSPPPVTFHSFPVFGFDSEQFPLSNLPLTLFPSSSACFPPSDTHLSYSEPEFHLSQDEELQSDDEELEDLFASSDEPARVKILLIDEDLVAVDGKVGRRKNEIQEEKRIAIEQTEENTISKMQKPSSNDTDNESNLAENHKLSE